MKLKVDTRGLKAREKAIKALIAQLTSRTTKNFIGLKAVDIIYKRTKAGKGISSATSRSSTNIKLKPLSESYKEFRRGKAAWFRNRRTGGLFRTEKKKYFKKPVLGRFGSPNRSNLTFTGQMLESMQHKLSRGRIVISINNNRRKDGLTNKQVANYASKDRPFLNLSISEQRLLLREYRTLALIFVKKLTKGN